MTLGNNETQVPVIGVASQQEVTLSLQNLTQPVGI